MGQTRRLSYSTLQVASIPMPTYDVVARTAHWLTFLLVTAEFIDGWCMPEIEWGTRPVGLIGLHLILGGSLLLLVLFRLVWRWMHPPPPQPPELPRWQRASAGAAHAAIYAMLLIMSVTGWASASARNWPVRAFGLLTLPNVVPPDTQLGF